MLQHQIEGLKLWWLTEKDHYLVLGKFAVFPTRDNLIKDAVGFVFIDFKTAGLPRQRKSNLTTYKGAGTSGHHVSCGHLLRGCGAARRARNPAFGG
jgi:hypothetical protein